MPACLHFVGFRNPDFHKDSRYNAAVKVFGTPDMIHRLWDIRAQQDIAPGDTVIFAAGSDTDPPSLRCFDDSHDDYVIAAGGENDR